MTSERWQQIKAAYAAILDAATPSELPALLERHCAGDPDLRLEVEKLLSDEGAGSFLQNVVDDAVARLGGARDFTGGAIGPYRVLGLLGRGGMGEVYAAEDSRLGRRVALKLLPALHRQDSGRIRRFQQEARAASALNHPNILTIYDVSDAGEIYYIATELVEGRTLRQVLSGAPLPAREILAVAVQIAGALTAAHQAGIVHRDIKPENIMVRPDGYVKILDFGLSKLRETEGAGAAPSANLTLPGAVMGTARYMSPEQTRGLPVDGRSDLFSVGVVLYEMAAGRPPFQGESSADVAAAILSRDPPSLAGITPHPPPQLEAILLRCLRKDRDQRYQSAQELFTDLRRAKEDLDSSQASRPQPEPRRGQTKKRLIIAALVALLTLASAFAVFNGIRRGGSPWYQTTQITKVAVENEVSAGVISSSGRYIVYQSTFPNGKRSLSVRLLNSTKGIEVVPPALLAYYAVIVSPDEAYLYYTVNRIGGGDPGVLFRVPLLGGTPQQLAENVDGLAISPDGSKIAFQRHDPPGLLILTNADGSNPREVFRWAGRRYFRWSPGGKDILYLERFQRPEGLVREIWGLRLEGGTIRKVASFGTNSVTGFWALPADKGYLVTALDPDTYLPQVWYAPRNGTMARITHDPSEYQGFSVTGDGKQILADQVTREAEIWVVDMENPETARQIADFHRQFRGPVWTRTGKIVVTSGLAGSSLRVINPDGSGEMPLPEGGSMLAMQAGACPDRDVVVFASPRNGATNVWLARLETNELKQLTFGLNDQFPQCIAGGVVAYRSTLGGRETTLEVPIDGGAPLPASGLAWDQLVSPDGRLTLSHYVDQKTRAGRFAIRTRYGSQTVLTFPASADVAAWAPNSRGIAYMDNREGDYDLWYQSLDGRTPRKLTHLDKLGVFMLNWSPDARYIVCEAGRFTTNMVLIQDVR